MTLDPQKRITWIHDALQRRALQIQLADAFRLSAIAVSVPEWFDGGWVALQGYMADPLTTSAMLPCDRVGGVFELACLGATVNITSPSGLDLARPCEVVAVVTAGGKDGAVLARGKTSIVPADYSTEHILEVPLLAVFRGGSWGDDDTGIEGKLRFPIHVAEPGPEDAAATTTFVQRAKGSP